MNKVPDDFFTDIKQEKEMTERNEKEGLVAEIAALKAKLAAYERRDIDCANGDTRQDNAGNDESLQVEARIRQTLGSIPHGVLETDLTGRILYGNAAYHKILGFPDQSLVGTSLLDRARSEEERVALNEMLAINQETRPTPYPYMTNRRRADGSQVELQFDWNYQQDSQGNLVGYICVLTDITDRVRAEEELRKSLEKYRDLVDTSQDIIWHLDYDGVFTYVNPAFEDVLEYAANEIVGHHFSEFKDPAAIQEGAKRLGSFLDDQEPVRYETVYLAKSGKEVTLSIHAKPRYDEDGQVVGFQGTAHDITRQKQAEEQLRQSQKMQALGTLAGGIAHDFNNVLTPILGNAELLAEDLDASGGDSSCARSICENALRAKDLVSQILLFSRRGQITKEVVDVCPLIPEVVSFARSTLPASISIVERIAVSSAPVRCDASQIYQVLVNLCVNAEQAITGSGNIELLLDIVPGDEPIPVVGKEMLGPHVCITMKDDGAGMDSETLLHIFEPFYTTKGVGLGTGLGLSTAFGIIESHHGGIAVVSGPRKGTSISVYLPLSEMEEVEVKNQIEKVQGGGTERILFVDDEDSITALGKISLERLGYSVVTASDGQAALALFLEDPESFDLVVTDQTMPRMAGNLLVTEILKVRPEMLIVLCSGHNSEISPENSRSFGIHRFVYKPYRLKDLSQVVRELLDNSAADSVSAVD